MAGGAPDLFIFEGHEGRHRCLNTILFELKKLGTVNRLVQQIDTHGGIDRWRQLESVSAHFRNGGVLWPLKH